MHGTQTALMAIHWTEHSAGNCETCGRYSKGSKGGWKKRGRIIQELQMHK